ncbi:hypothetical protein HMPREF9080_02748 [Cardiobacterium valvarum F0432]|uniref:Uncharacterized protein n=1 Tax=Cardiobacterium valvarum F0432 TaxID=797473 RepID=G9ZIY1_9GAMM|nr:hypothetical protein HMPREF9080_02748 [Cardiobacterium valvarum F0432]
MFAARRGNEQMQPAAVKQFVRALACRGIFWSIAQGRRDCNQRE